MKEENTDFGAAAFHTTRWTRVMAARGDSKESKAALSELCEVYYAPVRAFIVHTSGEDAADDLTQAFFARILERAGLDKVDPERGRFRSYLLGAVKHFVRDQNVKMRAAKRGGGDEPISVDNSNLDLAEAAPSDVVFDREWALALIGRSLEALEKSQSSPRHFEILKPWLGGHSVERSQVDAAAELDISEGAVKVAIHRLRKRFRQCVRDEITQTVTTAEDVSDELNYLIEVLGNTPS